MARDIGSNSMKDHAEIQQTLVKLLKEAGEHTRSPYSDNTAKLHQLYAKMGALCGVGYLECGE